VERTAGAGGEDEVVLFDIFFGDQFGARQRDGRSARAQTTPESTKTSPDWRPCVMTGRLLARLMNGRAIPPNVARKRRRVAAEPIRIVI
jgi:hypothetical protein